MPNGRRVTPSATLLLAVMRVVLAHTQEIAWTRSVLWARKTSIMLQMRLASTLVMAQFSRWRELEF
eukprot:4737872-Amphidinium_carterae.1